jgi:hypothetical protein
LDRASYYDFSNCCYKWYAYRYSFY